MNTYEAFERSLELISVRAYLLSIMASIHSYMYEFPYREPLLIYPEELDDVLFELDLIDIESQELKRYF